MPKPSINCSKVRVRRYPHRAFRLHIDHLENPSEDVWAVSWKEGGRRKYVTAQGWDCRVPTVGIFRGADARQPRAYVEGVATIVVQEVRRGRANYRYVSLISCD